MNKKKQFSIFKKNSTKKTLGLIFLVFILSIFFYSLKPLPLLAQSGSSGQSETLKNLNISAEKVDPFKGQINDQYNNYFQTQAGKIVGLALSFIGVVFLILMIYAGILWMTASGNDQQVKKAKDLLTNAAIGLVITLAAYAITNFIGTELLNQ